MNHSGASGGKLLFLIGSQLQISHFKQMGKINVIKSANLAAVLVPLHFPLVFKSLVLKKKRERKKKEMAQVKISETPRRNIISVSR